MVKHPPRPSSPYRNPIHLKLPTGIVNGYINVEPDPIDKCRKAYGDYIWHFEFQGINRHPEIRSSPTGSSFYSGYALKKYFYNGHYNSLKLTLKR